MSLSGIDLDPEIVEYYENERMGDGAQFVLKIEDEKISVESEGKEFETLVGGLPKDEPRYILYDVPIKNRANLDDLQTVFIVYMPMTSPVRKRMLYSSTKNVLTSNLRAISMTIQVEEKDTLSLDYVRNKVNRQHGINNP